MKKDNPEELEKKEKLWGYLKKIILEDLSVRGLDESDVGEITLQSKLIDLGLRDSLERRQHGFNWLNLVHVIDELETKFSIEIDYDRLLEFATVGDILKCLLKKLSRRKSFLP